MIEAVVQTGPVETSYRRAGAGPPVLLLVETAEAEAGDWLFDQLAGRFRTIAPTLPVRLDGAGMDPTTDRVELEGWLRGLIDGLGLERPAVVAGAARGTSLLRFLALDPERVARVALVQLLATAGTVPSLALFDTVGSEDPHPVLVLELPGPEDEDGRTATLESLMRFLAATL
jgi:pimeloyl-ACP methyl ester carboxylesterase